MNAANMKTVTDGKGSGKNFIPSKGTTSGTFEISKGNTDVSPSPKPAANSGTKISLGASNAVVNLPLRKGV